VPGKTLFAYSEPFEATGYFFEAGNCVRTHPRSAGRRKENTFWRKTPKGAGFQRAYRIREGQLRLYAGPADPEGCEPHDRTRTDRGLRGADGRRQDHNHQSASTFL